MSEVLVLNSSALGSASISKQLVQHTLARLRARDPGLKVVIRDLGANPIPHLNTDSATVLRGAAPANEAQAAALARSEMTIVPEYEPGGPIQGAAMHRLRTSRLRYRSLAV
jgi:FMN-dependent NADH-azoreductase